MKCTTNKAKDVLKHLKRQKDKTEKGEGSKGHPKNCIILSTDPNIIIIVGEIKCQFRSGQFYKKAMMYEAK